MGELAKYLSFKRITLYDAPMTDNTLTKTLELAATGEISTAEFYQVLMSSEIFVIGSIETGPNDGTTHTIDSGTPINIKNWIKDDNAPIIPFFTSLEHLQKFITAEDNYVALSAEDFFQLTKGDYLILNPKSDHSKEFTPHEVSILIGQPDNAGISKHVMKKDTRALIGQPANYPHTLVDALIKALPLYDTIDRAYLALVTMPENEVTETLMIGLETQSNIGPLIPELATHIRGKAPEKPSVAFMPVIRNQKGVGEYMLNKTKPFYDRSIPADAVSKSEHAAKTEAKAPKPWYKFWAKN